jgi:hypothetical protein
VLGDLHRRCADSAGSADDQNLVTLFDSSLVAQELQRVGPAEREGCGLFKRQVGGLHGDQPVFRHRPVFRVRAIARAGEGEHLFARFEARHRFADGFDDAGQLRSKDRLPRSEDPEDKSAHKPEPAGQVEASCPPIACRHGGRVNPDQNFVVLGCRLWHLWRPLQRERDNASSRSDAKADACHSTDTAQEGKKKSRAKPLKLNKRKA